jgi:predicted enzyme related to lactoylglutathione lyase
MFPMVKPELRDVPEQWVSYIAVDDVDARVKKATAGGAKVMHEAFDIPGVGRIAALVDNSGAMICFITPKGM